MTRSLPIGEVRAFGDRALLIGVADPADGRALARAVDAVPELQAATETVVGVATVLVSLREPRLSLRAARGGVEAALTAARETRPSDREAGQADTTHTVACVFDGPDLPVVAARAGCSVDDVVTLLTGTTLTVSVMGFSPGFAYLDGLSPALASVPRRDSPRSEVPPGSVALANGHAAIYPTASPGGWQLVGRTTFALFSAHEAPYATLAPGDRVRFTVAHDGAAAPAAGHPDPAFVPPADARPVFEVVVPGVHVALQDAGRRGVASLGVPGAGPADPASFVLANRLAGNPDDASALDVTAGVAQLRCLQPCHVGVVGGGADVAVDGRPARPGALVGLQTGQVLRVGPMRGGLRSYVAVAGGFLGPTAFGSTASDELSGLGPGRLSPGHRLYAGPWSPPLGDHVADGVTAEVGPREPVELRVVAGPHRERFAPFALGRLVADTFVVDDRSNRVGLRLWPKRQGSGDAWSDRDTSVGLAGELDSQGMVTGALQVPPGGAPIVLGPDHATLGGYPVLAVVISADHGVLGQCAPGTELRFVVVDEAEAEQAADALRRTLEHAVVGHFPLAVD